MLVDATQPMITIYGKAYRRPASADAPMRSGSEPEMVDLTLAHVIVEAILFVDQGSKMEGSEQLDRFLLAQRFHDPVYPVELSNTDAATIEKQIAKRWSDNIQIAGQAINMIRKSPDPDKKSKGPKAVA